MSGPAHLREVKEPYFGSVNVVIDRAKYDRCPLTGFHFEGTQWTFLRLDSTVW